jgi:hypothetical protein
MAAAAKMMTSAGKTRNRLAKKDQAIQVISAVIPTSSIPPATRNAAAAKASSLGRSRVVTAPP